MDRTINYRGCKFELSEFFSEPLWNYFYNLQSLIVYYDMTKELVTKEIVTSSLYDNSSWLTSEEIIDLDEEFSADLHSIIDDDVIDGDDWAHRKTFIPNMQRNIVICMSLALLEALLDGVCKEIEPNRSIGNKGSYIQERISYLKKSKGFLCEKNTMKIFTVFSQIRNSFIHELKFSIPVESVKFLNEKTGPFADLRQGLSFVHVELLLSSLVSFGEEFQSAYYNFDQ